MKLIRPFVLLAAVAAGLSPLTAAAEGAPSVTGVAVTSDAGSDATYARGETIRVTVTFSEAVDVTGTPVLAIDMDPARWGRKRAAYESGSGTAALVFAHEVAEPNLSTQGIAVLADTLALNGGAIRSAATGADAALGHGGLAHDASHKVDWRLARDDTPPRLLRGEVDGGTMTLTFSEALDPASTGGRFMVDLSTKRLWSNFDAAGPVTVEGNVVTVELGAGRPRAEAGRLTGNQVLYIRRADGGGGALRDLAGNPVTAAHVLPIGDGVEWRYVRMALVNVTGPSATAVAVVSDAGADATYALGETVRVAVTFNEAVDVTGTPRLKLGLGAGAGKWAEYTDGSGTAELEFAWTVARGDVSSAGVAVLANTLERNGGGIRAAARDKDADLAHGGLAHDPSHKVDGTPDTTPPRLSATAVAGTTLTLAFDEAIDAAASPASGAFTVKRTPPGSSERNVGLSGTPAIEGARVTLTLVEAVRSTDTDVKVSYRKSGSDAGNRLRDAAGNEVAGFADEPVVNVRGDTTPPELVRGEIDSGTMTLYFSEPLDPDSVGGQFYVSVKIWDVSWSGFFAAGDVAISGNKVTVGLGEGMPRAKPGMPVAARYMRPTDPAAKALRDLAGNPVMAPHFRQLRFGREWSSTRVIDVYNITGVAPTVTEVEVSSDAGGDATYGLGDTIRIRLTFSKAVTVVGTPRLKIDFNAGPGDEKWAVYESGSGKKTLEFAYTVAQGDVSKVGIAVLSNTLELNGGSIRSAGSSEDAALAHGGISTFSNHRVDTTSPILSRANVDGATLTLIFDEALGAAASLANGAFMVKKTPQGGSEQDVGLSGSPAISGATVALTLASPVLETDTDVNVGYTRPTSGTDNRLRDAHGNEVAGFADEPVGSVDGDTTPPELVRGEIDGGTMTLYFSEPLDPDSVGGVFYANVLLDDSGGRLSFNPNGDVEISGNAVTVGLGIWRGRQLSARAGEPNNNAHYYRRRSDPAGTGLRDLAGNLVLTPYDPFGNGDQRTQTVILDNLTGVGPTVTGIEVSSETGDDASYGRDDTIRVTLTFSEAVAVTGAPRVKIDLSSGARDEKWAEYEEGSGTAELEFTYRVARDDVSDAGVAVLANTLVLNGGAIRGVARSKDAALSHVGLDHDPAHRVDARPPALSTAFVNGTTLTLTFNEALGAAASPANGAFMVKKTPQEGDEQDVSLSGSPAIDGATVTMTLANAVLETDTGVKVSYARPASGGLRDEVGNEVESFSDEPVTNGSRPPRAERAHVNAAELTITFDEALGAAASLANGAFTVKKTPQGGSEQTVSLSGTPVIDGATVTLTLANPVLETDTGVKVSYTKPTSGTGNRLRDKAGNEVTGFTDQAVTSVTGDITPPELVRGEIDGGTISLYFSEPLDPDWAGVGDFQVFVRLPPPGVSRSLIARGPVEISGNTVMVGLGEGLRARADVSDNHAFYKIRRADAAGGLRDLAGNPVRTPNDHGERLHTSVVILDNLTGVAPSVTGVAVSSAAGGDATYGLGEKIRVRLTLSKAVNVTGTPRVRIDFSSGAGDEQWADYEEGGGTKTLDFVYEVVEPNVSTEGIAVLANTLELDGGTIESALTAGESAALAHAGLGHDPAHMVNWQASPDGGAGGSGGPPSVTGVAVSSEAGEDATYGFGETIRVTLTFSEPVTVTGRPVLSIDMDPAHWGEKQAAYESGGGTASLDFVHTVVEPNFSTQGIAVLANTLALNGGTIKSAASQTDAELGHGGLGHDAGHKVDWRPSISVADARANEGAGAKVAFEVSLSRAFTGAEHSVTVDYATADGTAEAGEDYTATSGTLTFAAGETTKTVNVPVLDDALDEGEETFVLRLSNAAGGRIADGEATGTIANDDPLQKMWLSRFGRTVAGQVTDAVSDRLGAPLSGAQVTVAGQRVDLAQTDDGAALTQALTAVARVFGASEQPAPDDGFGSGPPLSASGSGGLAGAGGWPGTAMGVRGSGVLDGSTTRDLSGRELLLGSAFHLAAQGEGAGPGLAAWGRVTLGGFDGEERADDDSLRIDGQVTTGILGADVEWNRLLAGVAISVSEGEGTFSQPGVDSGEHRELDDRR